MAMGDALAINARAVLAAAGIVVDVVIPVPDTSRVAALQVAQSLSVPYREGFVKNRYVGRTFIMPGQEIRWVSPAFLCAVQVLIKILQAQERSPQAQRHGARVLWQGRAFGRWCVLSFWSSKRQSLTSWADSIVRGTTSKEIIQMARDAGAKKVIMASCAPPIRCVPGSPLLPS